MYATGTATTSDTQTVDLRSDTVTRPTPAMREAMATAPVGDDVYGDDPTVRALEERAAAVLGKEAGLLVSSGTQSNLTALLTHCSRGDEYIGAVGSHIARYEAGGAAVLGGISPRHLTPREDGSLDADAVAQAVNEDDPHFAPSRLLCMENTFNGKVVAQAALDDATAVARANGLAVHMDGARLMNAAVASNRTAAQIVAGCDTVSLCLSKGLGAPVGSVLCGPGDFVRRARRNRKLLGGGMRQAGILAACGLHALDRHVERLADDHRRAARLGEALSALDGVRVDPVETNMVWLRVETEGRPAFTPFMLDRGIVCAAPSGPEGRMRLVTHLDVDDDAIDRAIEAFTRWCRP